jgi:hypothetical protein
MSFGFSVGDIVTLTQFTIQTYQNWKNACGEYSEITGQLDSLQMILQRVESEAKDPASLFARGDGDFENLMEIMGKCRYTVTQLNTIVIDNKSLGSIIRSKRSNWDRLRLAHTNYKELSGRLTNHATTISAYLDVVSASSLGRVEAKVDELVKITNIIDRRAAEMRAGKHEASIWSVYANDDKETWRAFRRQLVAEGVSSKTIKEHKEVLIKYLKELNEKGLLDEEAPPDGNHTSTTMPTNLTAIPEERDQATSAAGQKQNTAKPETWHGRSSRAPRYEKPTVSDDNDGSSSPTDFRSGHRENVDTLSSAGAVRGETTRVKPTRIFQKGIGPDGQPLWDNEPPTSLFRRKTKTAFTTDADRENVIDPDPSSGTNEIAGNQKSVPGSKHHAGQQGAAFNFTASLDNCWRLITWPPFSKSELYPIYELPCLPEGWELYIDPHLHVIYIDTYAERGMKKCFWTPPIKELYPFERTPHGWEKIVTLFGRVYWVDTTYGLISYEHPLKTPAIIWDDSFKWRVWEGAQGNADYISAPWSRPLDRRRKGTLRLSDRRIPCQLTAEVWDDGLSDEAVAKRGDLWWGKAWERYTRGSSRTRYSPGSYWRS